jgi:hypothetical protein
MTEPRTTEPRDTARQRAPSRDPLYRAVMAVLAASVIVGALATLAGEALLGSRALASAGLGMAVICLALYWILRLRARRLSREWEDRQDGKD